MEEEWEVFSFLFASLQFLCGFWCFHSWNECPGLKLCNFLSWLELCPNHWIWTPKTEEHGGQGSWLLLNVLFLITCHDTLEQPDLRSVSQHMQQHLKTILICICIWAPIRETNSGAGAPAFCGHPVLHSVEPETETIVKNSWWFYSIKFENKRCFFHCMWTCEYKKISFQRGTFKKKFKTWKFALSWDLCEIKDFSCVYMCPSYEFLERVSDWCLCKACLMLRWYFHVCFVFF